MRPWLLAALLPLAGCAPHADTAPITASRERPLVLSVNAPLDYFARRVGGDAAEVEFPAPPGEDPDFWKPDDAALARFQAADLVLLNGAGYAKWTETAPLSPAACADTSAAFADRLLRLEGAVTHAHGPAGEHSHQGTAGHVWLDFDQARQQAAAVCAALCRAAPKHADGYRARLADLERDLRALDAEMMALASKRPGLLVVGSHPVFPYWARRYGVREKSVHWEASEVPDDKAKAELQELLKGHPARWMVWEGEPRPEALQWLQTLGVRSVTFPPAGGKPEGGDADWLTRMRQSVRDLTPLFTP